MQKRQDCDNIDWSNIPQELLSEISTHFKFNHHLSKFRAVCKQWRSSTPPPPHKLDPQLPLQIPTHNSSIFKESNSPLFVIRTGVYLLQPLDHSSTKQWLISLEELKPGKLRFCFPLTKNPVENLPFNFPKTLNLLSFRVSCFSDGVKLCFDDGNEDVFDVNGFCSSAIKFVLSLDLVFAIDRIGNLVCFELGSGQQRNIDYEKCCVFDDIVNFKNWVCGVDRKGRVHLIDSCELIVKVTVISGSIPGNCYSSSDRRKLLVESFGELYLINRPCGEFFEVFKLDFEQNEWDKVDSLGDRILLVTFDSCFFIEAGMLPGFRGNCILFPKNRFPAYSSGWCYPDDVLFEGANKYLEIAVADLNEGPSRGRLISSYSGLSDFFWPPPRSKPCLLSCAR